MKIGSATLELLKNFSSINPSIHIKEGSIIRTVSPQKTILAEAMISETFEKEFCIYELGKFISVLSLYKEPELNFKDKQVQVSSGNSFVNYTYADPSMIVSSDKKIVLPTEDVSVTLTSDIIQQTTKAVSILQLPEVALVGQDGSVFFKALNSKSPNSDDFSVHVGDTAGIGRFVSDTLSYIIAIEQHSTFN